MIYAVYCSWVINNSLKGKNEEFLLFQIEISGSIFGLNEEIIIKSNGKAVYWDKKTNKHRKITISFNELKEFETLFCQISEEKVGQEYPDALIYKIKKEEKSVTIIPSSNKKNESAKKLINLINKWASLGRGKS